MARFKITMVGGGSVLWMPRILNDMMLKRGLGAADYHLLDIDLRAAQRMAAYARLLAKRRHVGSTFTATKDAKRAIAGADVVLITISTGGLDAMERDIAIPEKYGIFHTVGDTVGPAGWSRALRNLPVFLELGRQFAALAPAAWILNYSNPMTALTEALTVETAQPVVGLCHGIYSTYGLLMELFGLKDETQLKCRFGGLNHFFWVLDFTVDGKPGYPMLRRRLGKKDLDQVMAAARPGKPRRPRPYQLAAELFREFGYLPFVADRHTSEFLPYCLAPDKKRLRQWNLERSPVQGRRESLKNRIKKLTEWVSGKAPLPDEPASRETAADIAATKALGSEFIDVVNVPNVGQIPNLPLGAVLETPGLINALGFTPLTVGPLPAPLLRLVRPHAENQQAILRAVLEEDKEIAIQALMADPLCSHLPSARVRQMAEELLQANRKWLPAAFHRG